MSIFRKSVLERLSSPEQLDQLVQVSTPIGWVALATASLLLVIVLAWGWFGQVAEIIPGRGILLDQHGLHAVLYLPLDQGKKIAPGMEVHLMPSTVDAGQYGFLIGSVTSVDAIPSTSAQMQTELGSVELAREFQQGGSRYQGTPIRVDVHLIPSDQTQSGFRWSSQSGPPSPLTGDTVCTAEIVTRTTRPIDLVIPYLRSRLGGEK